MDTKDYGKEPYVVNVEGATLENTNFRTTLWTGENLQLTVMSIGVGDDIGVELHSDVDQFIRIERGRGTVLMGDSRDDLNFRAEVEDNFAVIIPAGKWHNVVNTCPFKSLKLYSIYAPPKHPHGTIHTTKDDEAPDTGGHDEEI